MEQLGMQRKGEDHPIGLTEGQDYRITLDNGDECWMTPGNLRIEIAENGGIGKVDHVGPIRLASIPEGETATGGWADVEEAEWDDEAKAFIRPCLKSEPLAVVTLEEATVMDFDMRIDRKFAEMQTAYPSHVITREIAAELVANRDAMIAKVDRLEAAVVEAAGKPLDELVPIEAGAVGTSIRKG